MSSVDTYEIRFIYLNSYGEEEVVYAEMMTIPREGETIEDLYSRPVRRGSEIIEDSDGENLGSFTVAGVEYYRVGKYEDGSHGVEVKLIPK